MKLCSEGNINHATAHQVPLKIGQRDTVVIRFVDSHQRPFSWSAMPTGGGYAIAQSPIFQG